MNKTEITLGEVMSKYRNVRCFVKAYTDAGKVLID